MFPGIVRKASKGVISAVHKRAADSIFSAFLLWLVSKKPMHGYEMISVLRVEHQFVHVGPAHIYPILAGLLKNGLIRVKREAKGRRVRKLYHVTASGRKKLKEIKKAYFNDNLRTRFLREMLS